MKHRMIYWVVYLSGVAGAMVSAVVLSEMAFNIDYLRRRVAAHDKWWELHLVQEARDATRPDGAREDSPRVSPDKKRPHRKGAPSPQETQEGPH